MIDALCAHTTSCNAHLAWFYMRMFASGVA